MHDTGITLREAYAILSRSPFFSRKQLTKKQRQNAAKDYQKYFTLSAEEQEETEPITH